MSFFKSDFNLCTLNISNKIDQLIIQEKVLPHRFKEISPIDEISIGLVNPTDVYKEEFTFADIVFGRYFLLGIRLDVKQIPGSHFKKRFKEEMKNLKKEKESKLIFKNQNNKIEIDINTNKEKDKVYISFDEKSKIKQKIKEELLPKVLPSTHLVHCLLNLEKNEIYLDTNRQDFINKIIVMLENIFKVNFSVKDYGIKNIRNFIESLWLNINKIDGWWQDNILNVKDEENNFTFNGTLTKYKDEIKEIKGTKKVGRIAIGTAILDVDWKLVFNNKNPYISVKSNPKIKMENRESSIIKNVERIETFFEKFKRVVLSMNMY